MKTLVLATASAAALLWAGAASAQAVSQQYDAARQQFATMAQNQSASGANSDTSQNGSGNSTTIDQAGNTTAPQYSTVLQGGWGGPAAGSTTTSTGSTANVTQRGDDDRSVVMQADYNYAGGSGQGVNHATVNQSGAHKNAFSYQYGTENTSQITQSGADDTQTTSSSVHTAADGNNGSGYATSFHGVDNAVSQSDSAAAGARVIQDEAVNNSSGTVTQNGSDNRGTVVQWYAEQNSAGITQTGDRNKALTYQTGYGSSASIGQTGSDNKAYVLQVSGDQDPDYASNGNGTSDVHATITQNGTFSEAWALQSGTNNYSYITQASSDDGRTKQSGSGQEAHLLQNASDEHGMIEQSGMGNYAYVQQGDTSQYAYVDQNNATGGSNNQAYVYQDAGKPGALAYATQNGFNNYAFIHQH